MYFQSEVHGLMYWRKAITLQVDSHMICIHKLSDTQSILMYHSVVKVIKNCRPEFFKIKL